MTAPDAARRAASGEPTARMATWATRALLGAAPRRGSDEVAALQEVLRVERYAGGTWVGGTDGCPPVRLVHRGRLELLPPGDRCAGTIRILRPGDLFGDVEALLDDGEACRARALTDVVVLTIERDEWLRLMRTRPALARQWLVSAAGRVGYLERRFGDLFAGDLPAQVASLLLREAVDGEVRLSQHLLARLLGVQRSSVNRVLRDLADRGVVEIGYRRIRLLDRPALGQLAAFDAGAGSLPR